MQLTQQAEKNGGNSTGCGTFATNITVQNPQRWYPRGYGNQSLYPIEVSLYTAPVSASTIPVHTKSQRFGMSSSFKNLSHWHRHRSSPPSARLAPPSTSASTAPNAMFMAGANWIPSDSFLPRTTPEKRRELLDLVVDGIEHPSVYGPEESTKQKSSTTSVMSLVLRDIALACGNY